MFKVLALVFVALCVSAVFAGKAPSPTSVASTKNIQVRFWVESSDCGQTGNTEVTEMVYGGTAGFCVNNSKFVCQSDDMHLVKFEECARSADRCPGARSCATAYVNQTENSQCVEDGNGGSYWVSCEWEYVAPVAGSLIEQHYMPESECARAHLVEVHPVDSVCLPDGNTVLACANGEIVFYDCARCRLSDACTPIVSTEAFPLLNECMIDAATNMTWDYTCAGYPNVPSKQVQMTAWSPATDCTGTPVVNAQPLPAICMGGNYIQCEANGLHTYICANCTDGNFENCVDVTGTMIGAPDNYCVSSEISTPQGSVTGSAKFTCNANTPVIPSPQPNTPGSSPAPGSSPQAPANTPPTTPDEVTGSASSLFASAAIIVAVLAL